MWGTGAGTCRTRRVAPAATSTWFPLARCSSASNPATANANNYRPLQGYGDLNLATNNLYQNYNAMQVSWARHAGMYVIQTNYTFQKALGVAHPTVDPFNLTANYGPCPRTADICSTRPTRLTSVSVFIRMPC